MYRMRKNEPKGLIVSKLLHSQADHQGSVSTLPFLLLKINDLQVDNTDLQIVKGFDDS